MFFDPPGIVTEPGTVTAVLLLARLTTTPLLLACVVSVTVQVSVPALVYELVAQLRLDNDAVEFWPLPCNFTDADTLNDVLVIPVILS